MYAHKSELAREDDETLHVQFSRWVSATTTHVYPGLTWRLAMSLAGYVVWDGSCWQGPRRDCPRRYLRLMAIYASVWRGDDQSLSVAYDTRDPDGGAWSAQREYRVLDELGVIK